MSDDRNRHRNELRQRRPRSAAQFLTLERIAGAHPQPVTVDHAGTGRALLRRGLVLVAGFDGQDLVPMYVTTPEGRKHVEEARAGRRAAFTQ